MMAFLYLVAFQAILLGVFLIMLGYKVRERPRSASGSSILPAGSRSCSASS